MDSKGMRAGIAGKWRKFSSTGMLRNLLLFIPFLAIAAVFWLIVALDDDLQREYDVRVEIVNVPDSVTFISDPPEFIRVSVRDRGTTIAGRMLSGAPVLKLDFRSIASDGNFRVTPSVLMSSLRNIFGSAAQLLSMAPDSISLSYTTSKARTVPVVVVADIVPEVGKTVGGSVTASPAEVKVYSRGNVTDTLRCVYTYPIVRRNVTGSITVEATIQPIPGCRIEPPVINVNVPVEPLANRSMLVPIHTSNVPLTEMLMVYPRTVKVSYLVPMSTPDIPESDFDVVVDYGDVDRYDGKNIPLRLHTLPPDVVSATLELDSVEYTVIHR